MGKKIVVTIIIIIILLAIIISQFDISSFEDAKECKVLYHNSCTIITNKNLGIIYFSFNQICNQKDCDGSLINKNMCTSKTKKYFKKISKNQYKKIQVELKEGNLNSFHSTCKNIKRIING